MFIICQVTLKTASMHSSHKKLFLKFGIMQNNTTMVISIGLSKEMS